MSFFFLSLVYNVHITDLIPVRAVVNGSPVVVTAEVALTLVVVVVGFLAVVYVADVTF